MSKTATELKRNVCSCTAPKVNLTPLPICDNCGGELDDGEPVKPVLKEVPKKRFSSEFIYSDKPGESNYRITDNVYDDRIATCYLQENAEFVTDALNHYYEATKEDHSCLKKS